jgi:hypothetical protein
MDIYQVMHAVGASRAFIEQLQLWGTPELEVTVQVDHKVRRMVTGAHCNSQGEIVLTLGEPLPDVSIPDESL